MTGCERPVYVKKAGLCSKHYNRTFTHGAADAVVSRVIGDDDGRFLSRIDKTASCWIWKKATRPGEYPQMRVAGKNVCVHRWAYERFVETIPDGYQVDHLCRNIRCVNPEHLEAVTQLENLRRQAAANPRGECTLPDCSRPHRSRGLCASHYAKWIYRGKPDDYAGLGA